MVRRNSRQNSANSRERMIWISGGFFQQKLIALRLKVSSIKVKAFLTWHSLSYFYGLASPEALGGRYCLESGSQTRWQILASRWFCSSKDPVRSYVRSLVSSDNNLQIDFPSLTPGLQARRLGSRTNRSNMIGIWQKSSTRLIDCGSSVYQRICEDSSLFN